MLSTLQIAQNCVTVSRRQLHMGILVSLIMVLFATSHFRADWTMLFYVVPYVATVVFTLVAEQISRRAQDMRRESLGEGTASGQWAAIVAATAAILIGGALLYAITPQVSFPKLFWKFGQPGAIGHVGNMVGSGQNPSGQEIGENDRWIQADGRERRPHLAELTLNDLRKAARRQGMPKWQSSVIIRVADLAETIDMTLSPIRLGIDELWEDLKKWLKEHRREMGQSLLVLIVLALLVATWRLLKETRPGIWLFAYLDYLRLGILRWHLPGNPGAVQYYKAFLRLLDLYGLVLPATANAREYLADVFREYAYLRREAVELTLCFEQARYGNRVVAPRQLARMREIYRRVFHRLHSPDSGRS
jgi:hypothetical protein